MHTCLTLTYNDRLQGVRHRLRIQNIIRPRPRPGTRTRTRTKEPETSNPDPDPECNSPRSLAHTSSLSNHRATRVSSPFPKPTSTERTTVIVPTGSQPESAILPFSIPFIQLPRF
ncbi:hypothetical protein M434DRAFT_178261 [Hypoxylon sp. CO27-5]|nr:hypothetical protein M434DRAFT_178261 [Hypoxylon sp. CO27-5]